MNKTTIHLDNEQDRWRYTCPTGHRNWEATNGHFWCHTCASSHDPTTEPVFHHLHDLKTNRELERHQIQLTTRAGDYDEVHAQ